MKSDFKRIIEKWIPQNTKVLDLGCGDGDLLEHLKDSKNVNGFGIEIDISKANECLKRNIQDVFIGFPVFFAKIPCPVKGKNTNSGAKVVIAPKISPEK